MTAGVYLIIRFYYILNNFLFIKLFSFISIVTSILSGLVACVEPDLKRVVAMSTLSQLGLIMYTISLGEIFYCYFHIICHALFKALLFLSCGIIIYLSLGGQDRRFIGSFSLLNPILSLIFITSRISLFGVPFMAGFYSKDSIIEVALLYEESFALYFLLFLCCLLTITYSIRLFLYGVRSLRLGELFFNFFSPIEFYFPIGVLYIWAISLGKIVSTFFLFNAMNFVNLIDKLMGLVVLLVGSLAFLKKLWLKIDTPIIKEFLGDIIFLN